MGYQRVQWGSRLDTDLSDHCGTDDAMSERSEDGDAHTRVQPVNPGAKAAAYDDHDDPTPARHHDGQESIFTPSHTADVNVLDIMTVPELWDVVNIGFCAHEGVQLCAAMRVEWVGAQDGESKWLIPPYLQSLLQRLVAETDSEESSALSELLDRTARGASLVADAVGSVVSNVIQTARAPQLYRAVVPRSMRKNAKRLFRRVRRAGEIGLAVATDIVKDILDDDDDDGDAAGSARAGASDGALSLQGDLDVDDLRELVGGAVFIVALVRRADTQQQWDLHVLAVEEDVDLATIRHVVGGDPTAVFKPFVSVFSVSLTGSQLRVQLEHVPTSLPDVFEVSSRRLLRLEARRVGGHSFAETFWGLSAVEALLFIHGMQDALDTSGQNAVKAASSVLSLSSTGVNSSMSVVPKDSSQTLVIPTDVTYLISCRCQSLIEQVFPVREVTLDAAQTTGLSVLSGRQVDEFYDIEQYDLKAHTDEDNYRWLLATALQLDMDEAGKLSKAEEEDGGHRGSIYEQQSSYRANNGVRKAPVIDEEVRQRVGLAEILATADEQYADGVQNVGDLLSTSLSRVEEQTVASALMNVERLASPIHMIDIAEMQLESVCVYLDERADDLQRLYALFDRVDEQRDLIRIEADNYRTLANVIDEVIQCLELLPDTEDVLRRYCRHSAANNSLHLDFLDEERIEDVMDAVGDLYVCRTAPPPQAALKDMQVFETERKKMAQHEHKLAQFVAESFLRLHFDHISKSLTHLNDFLDSTGSAFHQLDSGGSDGEHGKDDMQHQSVKAFVVPCSALMECLDDVIKACVPARERVSYYKRSEVVQIGFEQYFARLKNSLLSHRGLDSEQASKGDKFDITERDDARDGEGSDEYDEDDGDGGGGDFHLGDVGGHGASKRKRKYGWKKERAGEDVYGRVDTGNLDIDVPESERLPGDMYVRAAEFSAKYNLSLKYDVSGNEIASSTGSAETLTREVAGDVAGEDTVDRVRRLHGHMSEGDSDHGLGEGLNVDSTVQRRLGAEFTDGAITLGQFIVRGSRIRLVPMALKSYIDCHSEVSKELSSTADDMWSDFRRSTDVSSREALTCFPAPIGLCSWYERIMVMRPMMAWMRRFDRDGYLSMISTFVDQSRVFVSVQAAAYMVYALCLMDDLSASLPRVVAGNVHDATDHARPFTMVEPVDPLLFSEYIRGVKLPSTACLLGADMREFVHVCGQVLAGKTGTVIPPLTILLEGVVDVRRRGTFTQARPDVVFSLVVWSVVMQLFSEELALRALFVTDMKEHDADGNRSTSPGESGDGTSDATSSVHDGRERYPWLRERTAVSTSAILKMLEEIVAPAVDCVEILAKAVVSVSPLYAIHMLMAVEAFGVADLVVASFLVQTFVQRVSFCVRGLFKRYIDGVTKSVLKSRAVSAMSGIAPILLSFAAYVRDFERTAASPIWPLFSGVLGGDVVRGTILSVISGSCAIMSQKLLTKIESSAEDDEKHCSVIKFDQCFFIVHSEILRSSSIPAVSLLRRRAQAVAAKSLREYADRQLRDLFPDLFVRFSYTMCV